MRATERMYLITWRTQWSATRRVGVALIRAPDADQAERTFLVETAHEQGLDVQAVERVPDYGQGGILLRRDL